MHLKFWLKKEPKTTPDEGMLSSCACSSSGLRKLTDAILLMQEERSGRSLGTHPSAKGSLVAVLPSAGSVERAAVKEHLGPLTQALWEAHSRVCLQPVTSEPLGQTEGVYSKAAR